LYVDTDVIYAILKKEDLHKDYAERILEKENLYTSVLTLVELQIVAKREISGEVSRNISKIMSLETPNIAIRPLMEKTVARAEKLRRDYGLGIFDSIHAASALESDKKIASTDRIYDRISGLKRFK